MQHYRTTLILLCVASIVAIHPEQACVVSKTCIIIIQILVVCMYVVSKSAHVCKTVAPRKKMISSGVAKKTMRAEIAVSSEQHKRWPATPVLMPLINMSVHTEVECTVHYAVHSSSQLGTRSSFPCSQSLTTTRKWSAHVYLIP